MRSDDRAIVNRRIKVLWLCLGVAAATITAAGCGSNAASPSPIPRMATVSIAGTWQGTVPRVVLADGFLQLNISQAGEDLAGSWILAPSTGNPIASGTIAGRLIGSTMSAALRSQDACPTIVFGTLDTAARISGSYSTFSTVCPSGITAPIALDRR